MISRSRASLDADHFRQRSALLQGDSRGDRAAQGLGPALARGPVDLAPHLVAASSRVHAHEVCDLVGRRALCREHRIVGERKAVSPPLAPILRDGPEHGPDHEDAGATGQPLAPFALLPGVRRAPRFSPKGAGDNPRKQIIRHSGPAVSWTVRETASRLASRSRPPRLFADSLDATVDSIETRLTKKQGVSSLELLI